MGSTLATPRIPSVPKSFATDGPLPRFIGSPFEDALIEPEDAGRQPESPGSRGPRPSSALLRELEPHERRSTRPPQQPRPFPTLFLRPSAPRACPKNLSGKVRSRWAGRDQPARLAAQAM